MRVFQASFSLLLQLIAALNMKKSMKTCILILC